MGGDLTDASSYESLVGRNRGERPEAEVVAADEPLWYF